MIWDNLFSTQTDADLLDAYDKLLQEFRSRGLVRSGNNPIADFAELLVAGALDLQLLARSNAGYDALDSAGLRYQIKARRLTPHNKSVQLGHLRNLDRRPFDVLAAVIYQADFSISYGALIPYDVVRESSSYSAHANAHIFHFRRSVLDDSRVIDITDHLSAASSVTNE